MIDWVPVRDRLPGDDGYKIVTVQTSGKARMVNTGWYGDGMWYLNGGIYGEVIAWAEVEPYGGE